MTKSKSHPAQWRRIAATTLVTALCATLPSAANADHAIGFTWQRTGEQLTIPVVNNSGPDWREAIEAAVANWNQSSVIESPLAPALSNAAACPRRYGKIVICDNNFTTAETKGIYVKIQWYVWKGHAVKAVVIVNPRSSLAVTPLQKKRIACLGLGAAYGLDLQDADFDNPDLVDAQGRTTCMDFSSTPDDNIQPNAHDYEELESLYPAAVTDFGVRVPGETQDDASTALAEAGGDPGAWGDAIRYSTDGRPSLYRKQLSEHGALVTVVMRED